MEKQETYPFDYVVDNTIDHFKFHILWKFMRNLETDTDASMIIMATTELPIEC